MIFFWACPQAVGLSAITPAQKPLHKTFTGVAASIPHAKAAEKGWNKEVMGKKVAKDNSRKVNSICSESGSMAVVIF